MRRLIFLVLGFRALTGGIYPTLKIRVSGNLTGRVSA